MREFPLEVPSPRLFCTVQTQMADRLVGLIGPGIGPELQTHRYRNCSVKLTGLQNGEVEVIGLGKYLSTTEDGMYDLGRTSNLQFIYHGKNSKAICMVLGEL